jgi:hypothetical protein
LLFKNNKLCIPKCPIRENLIKEKHSGGLSGHFGQDRSFAHVNDFCYWLGMQNQVNKFVEKCIICQHAKGRSKNTRLYQPLPIPSRPWDALSMDFVLVFSITKRSNDSIYVVVDIFSKMAHFIIFTKISDATSFANLFFKEVVKLHGLPKSIVSDRDTIFVGHFWRTLWKSIGTNLSFISSYHPQTHGETKVNRSLKNILRSLVNENPR